MAAVGHHLTQTPHTAGQPQVMSTHPTEHVSGRPGGGNMYGGGGTAHHKGHPEWKDYRHLHPRYKTSVEALRSLFRARFMSDHRTAAEHLDVEVAWDPPMLVLQGREPVRGAAYTAKWVFANMQLTPLMYKIRELDEKRTRLELLAEICLAPHRPWWLPATWLLPRCVTLQAEMHIRVSKGPHEDGSSDVITALDANLLNLGKLPYLVRLFNGAVLGYLPIATEAFWSPFVGILGDPSYRGKLDVAAEGAEMLDRVKGAATAAADKVQGAVGTVKETAQGAVAAVTGGGGGGAAIAPTTGTVTGKAAEKAQGAVGAAAAAAVGAADRAAGTAEKAAAGVSDGSMMKPVAETVRNVVQDAAGMVKEGVTAGAEKMAEMGGRGKKAGGGAAGRA